MHFVPVTRLLSLHPFLTRLEVGRSARSLFSIAQHLSHASARALALSSKVNDGSGITMRQRQEMSRLAVRLSVRPSVSEHALIIEVLAELLWTLCFSLHGNNRRFQDDVMTSNSLQLPSSVPRYLMFGAVCKSGWEGRRRGKGACTALPSSRSV